MNEYLPSPAWMDQMRAAAGVPAPRDEFVRTLRGRLTARGIALQSRRRIRARVAWGFAAAAIIIFAGVLIAGPQNVVLALEKILGYIPGIGIVQPGSIRVLAEPVSATRDGITLTLEQVVADSTRTIVVYRAEGLSVAVANSNGEGGPICAKPELLRLPDGSELSGLGGGGGNGWGSGYRSKLIYAAIPADVNEGTLVVPCILDMPPGKAPEDWILPFRLKPAPPDLTVMPVVDLPTPTVAPSARAALPGATPAATYGITLSLDRVITLDDGYVLVGSLQWSDERFSYLQDPSELIVTDADGAQIPAEYDQADYPVVETYDPHVVPFAYQIQGKAFHGPLKLAFTSIGVGLKEPVNFSFDTGPNPIEGQSWTIDRELDILGIPVRFVSAKLINLNGANAFELAFQAPLALRSFQLGLDDSPGIVQTPTPENPNSGGGGGGGGGGANPNRTGQFLGYVFPSGLLAGGRINLSIYGAQLGGEWSTSWNPPVVEGAPTATALPQACLTESKWDAIQRGPVAPIPPGLGGQILTMHAAIAPNPSLFLSGVDGSGEKSFTYGDGVLSPDGGQLLFGRDQRMFILDLASGVETAITSPGVIGGWAHWSPDGKRIAMTRFLENYHVVVMNADGSDLRRVTRGESIEESAGWTPDGKQVLYTALGEGGKQYLRLVDIETGKSTDLFAITAKAPSLALSPDGQWVAFMDRGFGMFEPGVYLSRLDGSDRRLMAQLNANPFFAYNPFWSPDGKWLAVSIQDAAAMQPGDPAIALIQPSSCEVAVLPNVRGEIRSWVP